MSEFSGRSPRTLRPLRDRVCLCLPAAWILEVLERQTKARKQNENNALMRPGRISSSLNHRQQSIFFASRTGFYLSRPLPTSEWFRARLNYSALRDSLPTWAQKLWSRAASAAEMTRGCGVTLFPVATRVSGLPLAASDGSLARKSR